MEAKDSMSFELSREALTAAHPGIFRVSKEEVHEHVLSLLSPKGCFGF